ncbi:FAD/NAD(P)-binding protein [Streptomyces sp. NPDC089424]|uniref:FAD/NAD(P)-binding protein n=1 Tax=Streptomyces sp. NPDC089424 TaxID=3365917 RepID=UPI003828255E
MIVDIAVIGAGASAVCLLDTLARNEAVPPGGLLVFEPSPHLWRGRPYRPDADAVLVNLPPLAMSARHGDDAHFLRWLNSGRHPLDRYQDELLGVPMPPRAVFGDYLVETAQSALSVLRGRGWRVDTVRERVAGATPGDRLVLRDASGAEHIVDRAVLCVGTGTPRDLYGLSGAPGFVDDPYILADTLRDLDPDGDVAVIGSGLTAVDVVAALAERGHRGHIGLLSRHGVLPAVQQRQLRFEPVQVTQDRLLALADEKGPLTLSDLVPLLAAELALSREDLPALRAELMTATTEAPAERLGRQLKDVDAPQRARRLLVFLVRSLGPLIMGLLSEDDVRLVKGKHFRTVSSICAPMPPVNAGLLLTSTTAAG